MNLLNLSYIMDYLYSEQTQEAQFQFHGLQTKFLSPAERNMKTIKLDSQRELIGRTSF